jgi:hypothetical protein
VKGKVCLQTAEPNSGAQTKTTAFSFAAVNAAKVSADFI